MSGGRPLIGGPVHVRLGEHAEAVDEMAARLQVSRAETVRRLVGLGLAAVGRPRLVVERGQTGDLS